MGLLRAALIFVIGNFTISIIDRHLNKVVILLKDKVPFLYNIFGDKLELYIQENKCMFLLFIITFFEFIM